MHKNTQSKIYSVDHVIKSMPLDIIGLNRRTFFKFSFFIISKTSEKQFHPFEIRSYDAGFQANDLKSYRFYSMKDFDR